jgi:hypothetical protein
MSDFSQANLVELREELRSRGLKVSGKKAVLLARLEEDEQEREIAMDNAEEEEGLEHEEDEEEEEKEEDDQEEGGDQGGETFHTDGGYSTSTTDGSNDETSDASSPVPAQWNVGDSLLSWVLSPNAALAGLCILLRFYNRQVSEPESAVHFAAHHLMDCNDSLLGWVLLLVLFTVVITHAEPNACRDLDIHNRVRVRTYALNTPLLYFTLASASSSPSSSVRDSWRFWFVWLRGISLFCVFRHPCGSLDD